MRYTTESRVRPCFYSQNLKVSKNAFQWDAYRPLRWSPLDASTRGCTFPGGVSSRGGGVPSRGKGVYLPGGVPGIPPHEGTWDQDTYPSPSSSPTRDLRPNIPTLYKGPETRHAHPSPCQQAHACENITFPQLCWRVVITHNVPFKTTPKTADLLKPSQNSKKSNEFYSYVLPGFQKSFTESNH